MDEWMKEETLTLIGSDLMECDYGTPVKRKTFRIRRFNMGRNDLCFCGSGKKQKYCHADIQEDSTIAALLRAYHSLKQEEQQVTDSICAKGCVDCCTANFGISYSEFFMILSYLKIDKQLGLPLMLMHKNQAMKLLQDNGISGEHTMAGSCIFVDDLTGECQIYEVRPLICRAYGTLKTKMICPKIKADGKAFKGLRDADMTYDNVLTFHVGGRKEMPEPLPIAYYFSILTDEGELKTQRLKDAFEAAFKRTANDFIKILLIE